MDKTFDGATAVTTFRHTLLLLLAVGGAACVPLGEPTTITTWQATLLAEFAYPGLTGQAAAVSRPTGTQVGIGIDGAEPGAAFAWGLSLGSCDDPGAQLGPDSDYPELPVSPTGTVDVVTELGPRLSPDQPYFVEIRASASDNSRVACGDLHQVVLTAGG